MSLGIAFEEFAPTKVLLFINLATGEASIQDLPGFHIRAAVVLGVRTVRVGVGSKGRMAVEISTVVRGKKQPKD
jgi:hypothetical protein